MVATASATMVVLVVLVNGALVAMWLDSMHRCCDRIIELNTDSKLIGIYR